MFTISEIIEATQGQLIQGQAQDKVKAVCIDSRMVKRGELFIAVKGEIFDGHDFIQDVIAKGVKVLVIHKPIKIKDKDVAVILVKDTIRALGDVARYHRLRFKAPVLTITGSAGKTTTKEMIAAVLSVKYKVLKNEGTQNNHIGVPLTLLKLNDTYQVVVLECGTNQPGDIPWLADVARADFAIFTNIGESHLEKLKTPQGVLKEKWALTNFLDSQGIVITNADDPYLEAQSKKLKGVAVVKYGIKAKTILRAQDIKIKSGRHLQFQVGGQTCELNSCGVSHVYNALIAYACGLLFSVPASSIVKVLKHFDFPQGRGQIVPLGRGWLINDVYNANPVSMRSALQTLGAITTKYQRILIAADMLELGSQAKSLHKATGEAIAKSNIDVLITVGDLAAFMGLEASLKNKKLRVFICKDIDSAQKSLAQVFKNGDVVLIKGSRRMRMEQVVEFLLASPKGSMI